MRVWLGSFLVMFALSQFFQWLKHFTLPLPIFILGGAFLAIASNYDKIAESNPEVNPPLEAAFRLMPFLEKSDRR